MRRWIAKKLCPEVFADAERYDYLRRRHDDLATWCGFEFPDIAAAVSWAAKSTRVHFMGLAEFYNLVQAREYDAINVGDISSFRESLRAQRTQSEAA